MSLETVIERNTEALERLIAVMQSGVIATATTAESAKAPRTKKADPAAAQIALTLPVVASGFAINPGDAEGTRYFEVVAHNTVYQQNPGGADCTLAGAVQVSGPDYLAKKAELTKKFPTAVPAEVVPPASAAPVATAATAPSATASADTVSTGLTFPDVVAKCQALHKAEGNAGLSAILTLFGAAKVPELAADARKFAEIIATIDAKLMGL